MTRFQKALKSYSEGVRYMQKNVGFKKADPGDSYCADRYLDGKRNFARKIGNKQLSFPKGAL